MIPAVTHKVIKYYVKDRMYTYPLKKSRLFVHIFVMHLGKIIINVGKYRNIAFHSKSLDMSHP